MGMMRLRLRLAKTGAVNTSRRRFTRAGLAGSAVMTLASRPALASYCSHSGGMSGNLSRPNAPTCRGLTPTHWKHNPNSWSVCIPGRKNPKSGKNGQPVDYDHLQWGTLKTAKNNNLITRDEFRGYKSWANYGSSTPNHAWPNPSVPPTTCGYAFSGSGLSFSNYYQTMMQAFYDGEDTLVSHACAALLNCHHFGEQTFGYSNQSLITFISNWSGSMSELKAALQYLNGRVG